MPTTTITCSLEELKLLEHQSEFEEAIANRKSKAPMTMLVEEYIKYNADSFRLFFEFANTELFIRFGRVAEHVRVEFLRGIQRLMSEKANELIFDIPWTDTKKRHIRVTKLEEEQVSFSSSKRSGAPYSIRVYRLELL